MYRPAHTDRVLLHSVARLYCCIPCATFFVLCVWLQILVLRSVVREHSFTQCYTLSGPCT